MVRVLFLILGLLILNVSLASAMPGAKDGCGTQECSKCHSLTVNQASELLGFAGVTVKSVKPAPSHGLFEIFFGKNGGIGIVYLDYGKKYLIQGSILDLKTKEQVIAHEKELPRPKQFSGVDPKLIPVQHAVVMGNPKAAKKIYVFTDPDCPYCRQLHPVLQQLAKQMPDLAINVMLLPLRQLHPKAYDKSRAVVTGKNKMELLDKAFEGKELPVPKGDMGNAAIDAIIKFAEDQGINGTPMILLPDGSLYQGQRNIDALLKEISGR